ncbi:MAG: sigma 54-interacting transcriptional regulator, partial [Alphaproteobacteria bacterium]
RVLQEGEFTPVGGRGSIAADVRVLAATNRAPAMLVRSGDLRQDLYYRLNVVPLHVPPLRERSEDIPALAAHVMGVCEAEGLPAKRLTPEAVERLKGHDWPGNVRELNNVVRRALLLSPGDVIDADGIATYVSEGFAGGTSGDGAEGLGASVERHLRSYFGAHADDALPIRGLYDQVLREVERPLVELTLRATHGNQLRAAEVLGVNRNTLRKKIRDLGITVVRGERG